MFTVVQIRQVSWPLSKEESARVHCPLEQLLATALASASASHVILRGSIGTPSHSRHRLMPSPEGRTRSVSGSGCRCCHPGR